MNLFVGKPYRCRDCGKGMGVRSRPRTFTERYVAPLLLMQTVRCVECFRRDYWSILTPVHEREEQMPGSRRNAA